MITPLCLADLKNDGGRIERFVNMRRLLGFAARSVRLISWKLLIRITLVPCSSIPTAASAIELEPCVSTKDVITNLKLQLARIDSGESVTRPSPAEGALSHEQWLDFHLRDAELHLSFHMTNCDVLGLTQLPKQMRSGYLIDQSESLQSYFEHSVIVSHML